MDKQFALALKYYEAGFHSEAWNVVRAMLDAPTTSRDLLGLAAALRLEARAFDEADTFAARMLEAQPDDVAAWLLKAQALFLSGQMAAADAALGKAAALPGQHAAGWTNLGNILDALGRPGDAVKAFARAIKDAPEFSPAHNNLGATLAGQGRFAAAAASYRRALACEPGNLAALNNLGVALLEQGLLEEAIATFDRVLAADPRHREAADNRLYAACYGESDPKALCAAHAVWGRSLPAPPTPRPADPRPDRRLRVGYISPDFCHHSVSFFIAPLLSAHDPAEVEVFCYADVAHPDAVTARLREKAHHWREISATSDDEVYRLIREDQIDVLVDLAGHTKGNRLNVFARRAAPVQMTGIGYPATTGMPAIDYRLCDAITDPVPGADDFSVETLLRLSRGLHCYEPPQDTPQPGLPVLTKGHITFGSFNKLAKVSSVTVALWSGVLKAVPEARLMLKSKPLAEDETRARVAALFAAQGIESRRLDLRGWEPGDRAHLKLYKQIDIALDTVPYNGTTTTCEALWMGVPVLTLMGRGHASRVGASLLTQVGLTEWIAASTDEFIARALRMASDVALLSDLRAGLRAHVRASSLCDAAGYARGVEAAYRAAWKRVCATRGSSAD